VIVNNLSTHNFVETVHGKYPQVQIIPLEKNLGYAGNNNIGIKAVLEQDADWILVLNDDTVVDRWCLSRLIQAGETDSTIGIVGPMVYHFDEPEIIQSAGGMLGEYWQSIHLGKNELDQGQFGATRPVEWISGCAILIRRALIEQIGLLDENYFLYWEETEFCIRAAKAGWKIVQVPDAKLWHKGVQRNYQPKPYVTYYSTRNYLFTLAKHKAPLFVRTLALATILRTLLSWSLKPRWRNKRDHRDAMWRGMLDFLFHRMGRMMS
jgi:GT2 family glycosyltransferase